MYSTDLYTDDTTIFDIQNDLLKLKSNLQSSLHFHSLRELCVQNGMLLSAEKTKIMLITTRQKRLHIDESILSLTYNDTNLHNTTGDKISGVNNEENLQRNRNLQAVWRKTSSYIWLLSSISSYLRGEHRLMFHRAYVEPHLNYCNIIWGNSSNFKTDRILKLQKRACKIILGNEYKDFENAKFVLNMLPFDQQLMKKQCIK